MAAPLTFNPFVFAGFVASAAVAIFLPVVLAFVVRRRTGVSWRFIGLGAATFFVSQILLRLPWQLPANSLLQPYMEANTALLYGWIAFSSFTAGLFEETGRYFGFRFFAKRERSWRVAAGAGVGHGGLESILLIGTSVAVSAVIYYFVSHGGVLPGASADVMEKVVAEYRKATPLLATLGGVERILALCVHFGLSIMVMQCLLRGQMKWLPMAIGFHTLSNLSAVLMAKWVNAFAAEGVIFIFAAAALFIAWKLRPVDVATVGAAT